MTGYLMSLNDGAISWRSSRQGGVTLNNIETEFVAASQTGQEVVYLRELLKGFGHPQKKPTEIWDLVRDDHVKLVKCAGTQNVSDTLTKSSTRPIFEKHREHMWGTRVPLSAFFSTVETKIAPVVAYSIKSPKFFLLPISLGKLSVQVAKVSLSTPTRGE